MKEVSGTLLRISEHDFILRLFPTSELEILLRKETDSDACSVPAKMCVSIGIDKDLFFKFKSSLMCILFKIFSSPHPNQFDMIQQGEDVQKPLAELIP